MIRKITTLRLALVVATCLSCMTACFPVDEAVIPIDRGGITQMQSSIGTAYGYKEYIDLVTGITVQRQPTMSWHMSLGSRTKIYAELNAALCGYLQSAGTTDFASVTFKPTAHPDTVIKERHYDAPSGSLDSLAIPALLKQDGTVNDTVYYVFLGTDTTAIPRSIGVRKIQFLAANESEYKIRVARGDGTKDTVFTVARNASYDQVGINLLTGETVFHEPPYGTWDICFTRFISMLQDDAGTVIPYGVVGVLLGPDVAASKTKGIEFNTAIAADTQRFPLSINREIIGHDWKTVNDIGAANITYKTDTARVYLIRDRHMALHALRFVDFFPKGTTKYQIRAL